MTEAPLGKGSASLAGLRGGVSGHHHGGQHHHGGRERDSVRDPADPAPFLPGLPTPMRVSLGRREDINPYATFRLPGAGGTSGTPGTPGPGLSPVHRHPLQSPQHTVCMVSARAVSNSVVLVVEVGAASWRMLVMLVLLQYGSCGDAVYTKIRGKEESPDWIPLHSLYQERRY